MPFVEFDGELDAPNTSQPKITYTEFDGKLDAAPKESFISKVGSAAKSAANGIGQFASDVATQTAKDFDPTRKKSVMSNETELDPNHPLTKFVLSPMATLVGTGNNIKNAVVSKYNEVVGNEPDKNITKFDLGVGKPTAPATQSTQDTLANIKRSPREAAIANFIKQGALPKVAANIVDGIAAKRDANIAGGMSQEDADNLAGDQASNPLGTIKNSSIDFDTKQKYKDSSEITRGAVKGYKQIKNQALGLHQFVADTIGADDYSAAMSKGRAENNTIIDAIGEGKSAFSQNVEGAVSSILSNLPGLLTGAAVPALSVMAAQSFGEEYANGKQRGLSYQDRLARASLYASAEVIGEKFGLTETMKGLKSIGSGATTSQIIEHFGKAAIKEIPGEELTTLLEFGADKFGKFGLTPEATMSDYLKQAADTMFQTVLQSGMMMGGGAAANRAVQLAKSIEPTERTLGRAMMKDVNRAQPNPQSINAAAVQALDPNGQLQVPAGQAIPAQAPVIAPVQTVAPIPIKPAPIQVVPERGVLTRAANIAANVGVNNDAALLNELQARQETPQEVPQAVQPVVAESQQTMQIGAVPDFSSIASKYGVKGEGDATIPTALAQAPADAPTDIRDGSPATDVLGGGSSIVTDRTGPPAAPIGSSAQDRPAGNADATNNALILTSKGKPFSLKTVAELGLKARNLDKTHEVVPVDGGFALAPKSVEVKPPIEVQPTEAPTVEAPALSIGTMPKAAEPITVKDGIIHIGGYPAQNFDTGDDITVKPGASNEQIRDALVTAGAVGSGQKIFGLPPKQKIKKIRNAVDPANDSLSVAVAKLGGLNIESASDIPAIGKMKAARVPKGVGSAGVKWLTHGNGLPADTMLTRLQETGYMKADEGIADMLDKLDDEIRHDKARHFSTYQDEGKVFSEAANQHAEDMQDAEQLTDSEMNVAEGIADEFNYDDLDFDAKGVSDEDAVMAALGFTEDEINGSKKGTEGTTTQDGTSTPEAGSEGSGGTDQSTFTLQGQDEAQIASDNAAKKKADDKAAADLKHADEAAKQDRVKKEIESRQQGSADNFVLGQTAEDSLAGQKTLLSLSRPPNFNPLDAAIAKATVNRINAVFSKKSWNVDLRLAPTFDALPDDVKAAVAKYGKDTKVKGVVHDGVAYVVADEHDSEANLEATILHEVTGHIGVRRLYGKVITSKMDELYTAIGGLKGLSKIAAERGVTGDLTEYAKMLGESKFTDNVRTQIMMEELLSHIAEAPKFTDRVKSIVGAIRAWLRDNGFAKLAKYGETDLLNILSQGRKELKTVQMGSGPAVLMVAYHGGPHDFDKFSTDKIGTGEGVQAYGHGLYFSSNKGVAEHYRNALAPKSDAKMVLSVSQLESKYKSDAYVLRNLVTLAANETKSNDTEKIIGYLDDSASSQSSKAAAKAVKDGAITPNYLGRLYAVDLAPGNDEYLLWDKPLSEQSEKIQNILFNELGVDDNWSDKRGVATGETLYNAFAEEYGGQQGASERLSEYGVKGIKYLDAGSRSDMSGVKWKEGVDKLKYDQRTKGSAENFLRYNKGDLQDAITGLKEQAEASRSQQYFDAAKALENGDLEQDLNYNFVIFDDADVKVTAKFSRGNPTNESPITQERAKQKIESILGKKAAKLLLDAGIIRLVESNKDQTKTTEFKRWFVDSKVVDEDGKPLLVYHGTAGAEFDSFKTQDGAYFSSNPKYALEIANRTAVLTEKGEFLMPVYLSIKNPMVITGDRAGKRDVKEAREKGYDGIVGNELYVAFEPTQIKSAIGNVGSFAPSNPDIRYSKSRAVTKGVTHPNGNVELFLDNLTDKDFDGVAVHEFLHSSLRNMLGDETYAQLEKQITSLRKQAEDKMSKGGALNQWFENARAAVPFDTPKADMTQELMGYAVQSYINSDKQPNVIKRWVESFLSAIRQEIIKHIQAGKLKNWAIQNIHPQDLAGLAVAGIKSKMSDVPDSNTIVAQYASSTASPSEGEAQEAIRQYKAVEDKYRGTPEFMKAPNGKPTNLSERNWILVQTPNFKKWFGDSKVVDENGEPGLNYHGTAADFSEFSEKKIYSGEGQSQSGSGFYFTTLQESASNYSQMKGLDGATVMPVFLSLKNSLHIDFKTGEIFGSEHTFTKSQVKKILMLAPNIKSEDGPLMNFGDIPYEGFNNVLNEAIDAYAGGNNFAALRNDFFLDDHSAWLTALNKVLGYDSAYSKLEDGTIHYVAWKPNQIKSAIGNVGTFSDRNDIRFSKASKDIRAAAWKILSGDMGLFQNPTPDSFDMQSAAREIDPGMKVTEDIPEADDPSITKKWFISMPDNTHAYAYENDKGQVWLDASRLSEGASGGTKLYLLVGSYAEGNGKVFIGDPAGLSDIALLRRTENMLSLALRFGSTKFMEPHKNQIDPKAKFNTVLGDVVRPLKWVKGNDENNIAELLKTSYANTATIAPEIRNVTFNFDKGRFEYADGSEFTNADFNDLSRKVSIAYQDNGLRGVLERARSVSRELDGFGLEATGKNARQDQPRGQAGDATKPAQTRNKDNTGADRQANRPPVVVQSGRIIGSATLKRAAITNTLSRAESDGRGGALLAQISELVPGKLKPLQGVLYSKSSQNREDSGDPSDQESKEIQSAIEGKSVSEAVSFLSANGPKANQAIAARVKTAIERLKNAGVKFNLHIAHVGDSVPRALTGARGLTDYYFGKNNNRVDVWLNGADVTGKVGVSYRTALHELVHAATTGTIRIGNMKAAQGTVIAKHVADLYAVTNFVIQHINKRIKSGSALTDIEQQIYNGSSNAFSNADETLAWALSHPDAQAYLDTIKYPTGKTVWSEFVLAIRRLLGLTKESNTALSEVLRISEALLSDNINELVSLANISGTALAVQQASNRAVLPEETSFQSKQRVIQDKFNRFKVIQDWLKEQGVDLSEEADVYLAETLMSGRISTRKQDFREQQMDPLIKETQDADITMEQIGDFLKTQHASEANKRAREIHDDQNATAFGITDTKAANAMDDFKKLPNYSDLKRLADKWRDVTEQSKKILVDSGILSQDMAKAWEDTYQAYVPVKGKDESTGTGKGLNVNGKQKRRLGHSLRDEAIIENIWRDYERAVSLDEKNLVGKALIRFGLEANNDDIITIGKPEKRQVLKKGEASYIVSYAGSDVAAFDNKRDAEIYIDKDVLKTGSNKANFVISKTSDPVRVMLQASPMLEDNEVNVYVGGHAVRLQINDEIAAREYTNLGVEHLNAVLAAGRSVNTFLSKMYTGYSPDFIFTNPIRDAIQGSVTLIGNHGAVITAKIFANYPLAVKELFRHFRKPGSSAIVTDYRANGGSTGAAYLSDLERIGNDMQAAYNEYAGMIATYNMTYKKAVSDGRSETRAHTIAMLKSGLVGAQNVPVIGHILRLMERVNSITENALRVATYHTLVKNGVSKKKAAAEAKNLMNFNRKGEISNQAGALYLFFNPNVQSTQVFYKALFESEHKGQARTLAGMMVLSAIILAELARSGGGDDEDKWKNTPDYVKDSNMVMGAGNHQITIPLPYGYRVFHTMGNVMSDYAHGGDGYKLGIRLASSVFASFSPIGNPMEGEHGLFQLLPTIPKALLGPSVNEDSFGRQVSPQRYNQSKPDSQLMVRKTKGTVYADAAEWMNKVTGGSKYESGSIDVSPETLKYWVSTLTGGAGKAAIDTLNMMSMGAQGVGPSVRDTPIIRRFVREVGVSDVRSAFYERANEAKKAAEAFSAARRGRDNTMAKDIWQKSGPLIELSRYAENQKKLVGAKRDLIDSIRNDETLTLAQKQTKMAVVEAEESAIYTRFIKQFDRKVSEKNLEKN